jgi:di/tricarboxylate transporter
MSETNNAENLVKLGAAILAPTATVMAHTALVSATAFASTTILPIAGAAAVAVGLWGIAKKNLDK